MDTPRLILVLAIIVVVMMLFQAWEQDYGAQQTPVTTETATQDEAIPEITQDVPDVPDVPMQSSLTKTPVPEHPVETAGSGFVTVRTDLYDIKINMRGGGIDELRLVKYPEDLEHPDQPVVLMDRDPSLFYVFQGGLISEQETPTHNSLYVAQKNNYEMSEDGQVLRVPLVWRSDNGIEVTKTYTFRPGSYEIELDYSLKNNSSSDWTGRAYGQLQRDNPGRNGRRLLYTYTGAVLSSPEERYKKINFDDMEDKALSTDITDGWAAMLQHYFISALIPGSKDAPYHYYTKALQQKNHYLIGMMSPVARIGAGETTVFSHRLYIGPKIQSLLEKAAPRLELTVDYGKLWFVAKPLFICLQWFHDIVNNWGLAIILVTLLVKIIFYPLSAAGYRSMANMRKVQPRLLSIRERYKDDKARLNQAMMDLYKKEKINPLGGCLPILIQIPVFIALYWMLLETVELRQAGFVFWLKDLSTPDPWYVLPVLMGISMFIQQKLNPAPMDPVQEKVMMTLPFVFTVFFAFFPSGLVLYWVVNNVLSIAQQWMITRQIEASGKT